MQRPQIKLGKSLSRGNGFSLRLTNSNQWYSRKIFYWTTTVSKEEFRIVYMIFISKPHIYSSSDIPLYVLHYKFRCFIFSLFLFPNNIHQHFSGLFGIQIFRVIFISLSFLRSYWNVMYFFNCNISIAIPITLYHHIWVGP